MLAGISHDLRTPLARIRLEAEISVPDEEARSHIADDIDQLDAIIDKFMDYARPGVTRLEPVPLAAVIEREAGAFRDASQIRIGLALSADLARAGRPDRARARVRQPVRERAPLRPLDRERHRGGARRARSRPGRGSSSRCATTAPACRRTSSRSSPRRSSAATPRAPPPRARASASRSSKKSIQRMGGSLEMTNAAEGGLVAHIRLRRVETA